MNINTANYTEEENARRMLRMEKLASRLDNKSKYINQMINKRNGFTKAKPKRDTIFMRSINKLNNEGTFHEKLALLFPTSPKEAMRFAGFFKKKYEGNKDMYVLYNMVHDKLMLQFSTMQASADLVFKTISKLLDNFDASGTFDGSASVNNSGDASIFPSNNDAVSRTVDNILSSEQVTSAGSRNDPSPPQTNNFGRTDLSVAPTTVYDDGDDSDDDSDDDDSDDDDNDENDWFRGDDDLINKVMSDITRVFDIVFGVVDANFRKSLKIQGLVGQADDALETLHDFFIDYHKYNTVSHGILGYLVSGAEKIVAQQKKIEEVGTFSEKSNNKLKEYVENFFTILLGVNEFLRKYVTDVEVNLLFSKEPDANDVMPVESDKPIISDVLNGVIDDVEKNNTPPQTTKNIINDIINNAISVIVKKSNIDEDKAHEIIDEAMDDVIENGDVTIGNIETALDMVVNDIVEDDLVSIASSVQGEGKVALHESQKVSKKETKTKKEKVIKKDDDEISVMTDSGEGKDYDLEGEAEPIGVKAKGAGEFQSGELLPLRTNLALMYGAFYSEPRRAFKNQGISPSEVAYFERMPADILAEIKTKLDAMKENETGLFNEWAKFFSPNNPAMHTKSKSVGKLFKQLFIYHAGNTFEQRKTIT